MITNIARGIVQNYSEMITRALRIRVLQQGAVIDGNGIDCCSVVAKSGSPATSPAPSSVSSPDVAGADKRREHLFRHKTLPLAIFMRYERYRLIATITPTRSHNFVSVSCTLTDAPRDSGVRGRVRAS
jgi:hypothetical protein